LLPRERSAGQEGYPAKQSLGKGNSNGKYQPERRFRVNRKLVAPSLLYRHRTRLPACNLFPVRDPPKFGKEQLSRRGRNRELRPFLGEQDCQKFRRLCRACVGGYSVQLSRRLEKHFSRPICSFGLIANLGTNLTL